MTDEDENIDIVFRESIISLLANIGLKKFSEELPGERERYWNKGGSLRACPDFLDSAFSYIDRWLHYHYSDYYSFGEDYSVLEKITDWEAYRNQIEGWYKRQQTIYQNLPFKISAELESCYRWHEGGYQVAPGLYFYSLSQATENFISKLGTYLLPIFHGDLQETYYVLCDNIQRPFSAVYYQFSDEEPIVYAECISGLITTIAQCYRDGGYYVAIDRQSGEKEIKQALDKIEPIFEKFNPEQIDNWRKTWKS